MTQSVEDRTVLFDHDGGVDDLLVVLADCLKDYIREGVQEDTVHEQLRMYVES